MECFRARRRTREDGYCIIELAGFFNCRRDCKNPIAIVVEGELVMWWFKGECNGLGDGGKESKKGGINATEIGAAEKRRMMMMMMMKIIQMA